MVLRLKNVHKKNREVAWLLWRDLNQGSYEMFYILESQHHKLAGMISYPDSGWGLDFTKGKLLDPRFGEGGGISVLFESNHDVLPDYFELSATPIVSARFLDIWKSLPFDNYQVFPVNVQFPNSQLDGYYILNIVGLVSCIDREKSELQMYKHLIMRVHNLVLNQPEICLELFRIQEFSLAIMISERIKERLVQADLSGLLVKSAEGWNDKHRF